MVFGNRSKTGDLYRIRILVNTVNERIAHSAICLGDEFVCADHERLDHPVDKIMRFRHDLFYRLVIIQDDLGLRELETQRTAAFPH